MIIARHEDIRVSIIVPCYFKHVSRLEHLLKQYELQTVLPDEVVISISEFDKAPRSLIDRLVHKKRMFPVRYILSKNVAFAGENRNKACRAATGDIFICQDADDLPYPNRVEIIKFLFRENNIDHIMHGYIMSEALGADYLTDIYQLRHTLTKNQLDSINVIFPKKYDDVFGKVNFTNGNVAIRRSVFEKIQWSYGRFAEDIAFNRAVYAAGQFRGMIILEPLFLYRQSYSSVGDRSSRIINALHSFMVSLKRLLYKEADQIIYQPATSKNIFDFFSIEALSSVKVPTVFDELCWNI